MCWIRVKKSSLTSGFWKSTNPWAQNPTNTWACSKLRAWNPTHLHPEKLAPGKPYRKPASFLLRSLLLLSKPEAATSCVVSNKSVWNLLCSRTLWYALAPNCQDTFRGTTLALGHHPHQSCNTYSNRPVEIQPAPGLSLNLRLGNPCPHYSALTAK